MNKITPENLLSRGFSKRDRNVNGFLGDSFYFEVFDVDMPDYEKMAIFIERGNGYDEECWNAIFVRSGHGYPKPAWLRYGLRTMDEVEKILSIFIEKL